MKMITLLAVAIAMTANAAPPAFLDVTNFGARAGDGSDTTPAIRAALEQCGKSGAKRVVFPPGTYDFWPDRAAEQYLYVSNNDPGLKRIAFLLPGLNNVEIDGQGSKFIFHGGINPFVLDRSQNITLKNFSIDWKRPFHNEARILSVTDDGLDIEIPEQFPYKVDKGLLFFLGEQDTGCGIRDRDPCPVGGLLEFDTAKHETAYMVRDYYHSPYIPATSIGPRRVHIVEPGFKATVGNTLVFGTTNRNYPAIMVSGSSGVRLANVTIHHCGGMGIIAQRSRDIELDHVQVTPSNGRMVSLTADATHFVNCTGRIAMTNCLFENQLDDATNIHGLYAQVSKRISSQEIEVKLVHPQQRGVDFIVPGGQLEFVHGDSLVTFGEARVESVARINGQYTRVKLAALLPEELHEGDAVASVAPGPDVLIKNCVIRGNRARGLLLGSRGKIVVEDNVFHTPGAAILMEGDARYWFEQAGVRDLMIRRNRFEDCNFGVWGKAVIEVGAGIEPSKRAANRYNRNIRIEDNQFRVFDGGRFVTAYSVDGLTFRMNHVESNAAYPAPAKPGKPFDITDSVHIETETPKAQ
jgi:hypothetical protein